MMLSPQAARMGTSIRFIGKSIPNIKRSFAMWRPRFGSPHSEPSITKLSSTFFNQELRKRFKSSAPIASSTDSESDEDEGQFTRSPASLGFSHLGHAQAAQHRLTKNATATENGAVPESWMINLGRGNDNAWLTGPRNEQEWFTGVAPVNQCPGKQHV
jgi:hypothetical protein